MSTFRAYRFTEVFLVAGFIFVGSFFAASDARALFGARPALFFLASYLVTLAVYAFNSWAGSSDDAANPRLAVVPDDRSPAVAAASLIAALALFLIVERRAAPCAAALFVLSALYSYPRFGAKYLPRAGTALHILGGAVQFQIGWLMFGEIGVRSLALALYFGLILSAGHVNHELIDLDADRAAGIRSGAVRYGAPGSIRLHIVICAAALALLIVAALRGMATPVHLAPFAVASLLQMASAVALSLRAAPGQGDFLRHRRLYRILYALAGIVFLAVKFGPSLGA
ncbi:MAG TPA: UbiA family prenyltransferase [bacterium]|nr:UbiA family prenyltransferase [bacterium]